MLKSQLLSLARKYPIFAFAKNAYQSSRDWYYRVQPIDDKLIVFEAFRSTKYADSPKAIYEYLLNHDGYRDFRFIWVFENPEEYEFLKNDRTTLAKHESNAYYTAFARAKYWVVNGWIPLRVQKKPGQVALQCWHGTPLKRLRHDIVTNQTTNHQENALRENDEDMKRYDYLISPSKFTTRVFTSAFNLKALKKDNIVIETGYPRNDALINATSKEQETYRKKYGVPKDKKVLLYAPTWRDDQHVPGKGYEYKMPVDFDLLEEKLSEEYFILFRAHNLVANKFDFTKYDGFIKDVSSVNDINELYIASDILVTDYSSVFFDYANLGRPIIFYMYDRAHYENNLRGFYLSVSDLPGEIVETETQLIKAIEGADSKSGQGKMYKKFSDTYNYLDDGGATKRVVVKLLGEKED